MTNEKKINYNKFGFRMAIFGHTLKEQVQSSLGLLHPKDPPLVMDKQVDDTIKKVNELKNFIEVSYKSIKEMIAGLTKVAEAEQRLSTLLQNETCNEGMVTFVEDKYKEQELKSRYHALGVSFNKDNKDLDSQVLVPLKNYESWLHIFLTKAIADIEETLDQCKQLRIEIFTYESMLGDAKERLKYEVSGSMEYASDIKIVDESEISLENKRKKYENIKVQLFEKAEMLEIKRKADLPSYLDSVHVALLYYHQRSIVNFTLPSVSSLSPPASPLATPTSISSGNGSVNGMQVSESLDNVPMSATTNNSGSMDALSVKSYPSSIHSTQSAQMVSMPSTAPVAVQSIGSR